MDLVDVASAAGIVVALGGSALLLRRLAPVERGVVARLRARLLLGLPVGTLLVVGFVLAVYLFVQDGLADTADPLVIPFRAWSYVYPLGVLTSAFAHDGPGHLTGNLLGTLVYGSLAEYAWGHVPPGRRKRSAASGGPTRTSGRWWSSPA
ncbi:hypothetical protein BRD17_04655 [Halobacteriales archaeon SW_7_68_16]|nr:MAG: hypothetical protein BRD17_04655 [Halobacteriales archaeon SW_7_68_16]